MKFKTKLYLGFGAILLLIIILFGSVLYIVNEQKTYTDEIVKEHYEKLKHANIFQHETNNTARYARDILLINPNDPRVQKYSEYINQSRIKVTEIMDNIQDLYRYSEDSELIARLDVLNTSYERAVFQVIELAKEGRRDEGATLLIDEYLDVREQLVETFEYLTEKEEIGMNQALERSIEIYDFAIKLLITLTAIAILIGLGIIIWVVRSISSRIENVRSVISSVTEDTSDKLPRVKTITKDEIGDIAVAYNNMAQTLEDRTIQENILKHQMQEENWIKSKLAEITTTYQGIQTLDEFSNIFISYITPIVGGSYGAFYIKAERDDRLTKLAAYADSNEDVGEGSFRFGQGLVGQCAEENKVLHLTSLPEGYLKVTSALGSATPPHLLVLPIDFEDEVIAVCEIASFQPFDNRKQEFLQHVMNTVGISLDSIIRQMKIEQLLQESQALTEELQSQSEELQQQQEELTMINEQLEEQYKNSEEKTRELGKIKEDLEDKNRQVELTSKYKSEFLANMSHELRTPLNSMLILSQMLAENHEGNLTSKQIDYANTVYSSGKDLLALINDILDLSKIESGKFEVYPEKVLLSDVSSFMERQFYPVARTQGIDFSIDISPDTPEQIFTDDQRLKQIIKNLLSNAFKFTEKGSVNVKVQPKYEEGDNKKTTQLLTISISDTGIGIPKEKYESIFEAFQQADGTTSRKYGGSGLGLSISRELAQMLGGYIKVRSVEGEGSTFTLYLPDYIIKESEDQNQAYIAEVAAAVEEEAIAFEEEVDKQVQDSTIVEFEDRKKQKAKELLEGKKVLIVDDDMRNVFSLTTALEMRKMDVIFAENGKEALEVLQNNPDINIVLMDIMMPIMNGYETMRAIREIPEFEMLPIIALTAKAMKNDREKCLDAGASDYISKPVNLDQLFSLIRVWLYR
ncbi:ATP-binding protein [Anaerobacillus sp. MEB173]|uniref:ATP-binding protein n=1 Tax=Anaerobacillus sp. MEB173 TaxID=3383345 RepID=UPI003F90E5F8